MQTIRFGKTFFNVVVALGAYGVLFAGMRGTPALSGGQSVGRMTEPPIAPADYADFSVPARLSLMRAERRVWERARAVGKANSYSSDVEGYNALAAATPPAALRDAHLPPRLP